MYKFVFGFASERNFKNVDKPIAIALWQLFFGQKCKFLTLWEQFLEEEKPNLKVITFDTWDLFYDLVTETKGELKNFEDHGAWPVLVDEFMMFYESKK